MWKLDREDDYFRIYDSNKDIAGYFDPDFGELFPKEQEQELIEKMHKNHEKIPGGFLMVPMVKFGIFEPDKQMNFDQLQGLIDNVKDRLSKWKIFNFLFFHLNNLTAPDLLLDQQAGASIKHPSNRTCHQAGQRRCCQCPPCNPCQFCCFSRSKACNTANKDSHGRNMCEPA